LDTAQSDMLRGSSPCSLWRRAMCSAPVLSYRQILGVRSKEFDATSACRAADPAPSAAALCAAPPCCPTGTPSGFKKQGMRCRIRSIYCSDSLQCVAVSLSQGVGWQSVPQETDRPLCQLLGRCLGQQGLRAWLPDSSRSAGYPPFWHVWITIPWDADVSA
jgi:hypothetical protein